jgi:aspartate semialdehyde dehydrogenase (EC 1.2.1.11)
MQAISGAGFEGIPGMSIFDNVIPYIGGEEEKMERETLKIMGTFDGSEVVNAPFLSVQVVTGSRSLTDIPWQYGLTSRNRWRQLQKHSRTGSAH